MSCTVEGEAWSSRPFVQLAMQQVMCMEDATMFIALAAAVNLRRGACRGSKDATEAEEAVAAAASAA